jgi:hypothetical protein
MTTRSGLGSRCAGSKPVRRMRQRSSAAPMGG